MSLFRRSRQSPSIVGIIVLVIAVAGLFAYTQRSSIRRVLTSRQHEDIPVALNRSDIVTDETDTNVNATPANTNTNANNNDNSNTPAESDALKPLRSAVNLNIPFTVQAPNANWDGDHEEFCEEASVLMASRFMAGQPIKNAADAEAGLQDIKKFEVKTFGYFKDTTAEETARILREKFKLKDVRVVYDPKIEQIKRELSDGHPILVPSAGRQLGNPYFQQPGPLYHMLILKGYTKDGKLISNDPGTKRGADYVYSPSTILKANHDWNDGDVDHGRKVMIVVRG